LKKNKGVHIQACQNKGRKKLKNIRSEDHRKPSIGKEDRIIGKQRRGSYMTLSHSYIHYEFHTNKLG